MTLARVMHNSEAMYRCSAQALFLVYRVSQNTPCSTCFFVLCCAVLCCAVLCCAGWDVRGMVVSLLYLNCTHFISKFFVSVVLSMYPPAVEDQSFGAIKFLIAEGPSRRTGVCPGEPSAASKDWSSTEGIYKR